MQEAWLRLSRADADTVDDSVGIALMVVLETLPPAERPAFVLHDLFAVPFDEIAPVLGRGAAATRQLASRGPRRVQGVAPAPDPDPARLRAVVDAFLAASRGGDFDALVDILDPEAVARSDGGALRPSLVRRGAAEVASQAIAFARFAEAARPVLVNGLPGVVGLAGGRAMCFGNTPSAYGSRRTVGPESAPSTLTARDGENSAGSN